MNETIKVLKLMKEYKNNPNRKPNVKDDIDYNLYLVLQGEIPIEEFGQY